MTYNHHHSLPQSSTSFLRTTVPSSVIAEDTNDDYDNSGRRIDPTDVTMNERKCEKIQRVISIIDAAMDLLLESDETWSVPSGSSAIRGENPNKYKDSKGKDSAGPSGDRDSQI